MRYSFSVVAAATFAAAASAGLADDLERAANEFSCGVWKGGVAINKGLIAETTDNKTVYKDANGVEFTAWSQEDGYTDSRCDEVLAAEAAEATAAAEAAAAAAAEEQDGATYISFGAAIVATGAALIF